MSTVTMVRAILGSFAEDVMCFYFSIIPTGETLSVMEEDWDTLIILDACRYDTFVEVVEVPGETEKRESQATATDDFLRSNFIDGPYYDTVYVTANPRIRTTGSIEDQFHDVVHVWQTNWHDQLKTTHPKDVVEKTLEVRQEYPSKRMIVHFMQPHGPFIGPIGREQISGHSGIVNHKRMAEDEEPDKNSTWIWKQLREGHLDESTVREAYRENLKVVIPYLKWLFDELAGKVAVTSDHGNMIGERAWPFPIRLYGHPNGIRTSELVDVPWHVREGDRRPEIKVEEPQDKGAAAKQDDLAKRLSALGYR